MRSVSSLVSSAIANAKKKRKLEDRLEPLLIVRSARRNVEEDRLETPSDVNSCTTVLYCYDVSIKY